MANNESRLNWAPVRGKVVAQGDDRIVIQRKGDDSLFVFDLDTPKLSPQHIYYPCSLLCTPEFSQEAEQPAQPSAPAPTAPAEVNTAAPAPEYHKAPAAKAVVDAKPVKK